MPTMERMRELLDRHLKALRDNDWKTYKAGYTEEGIYEEEATGVRAKGPDAIVRSIEPWKRAFPDMDCTVKDAVASGDAIVVEVEWTGTHNGPLVGPFGTIEPTGKFGTLPAVQVVRFEGERIRELRHYFDLLTLLRQAGMMPQLGAPAR